MDNNESTSATNRIGLAEIMLAVWAVCGVIGGIVLAVQKKTVESDFYRDTTSHPFVAVGLAIILATVVTAALGNAVLGYMRARLAL